MAKHRRYPAYDVWEEHANWDVHTRQIVGARKMPQVAHSYLLPAEALLLQAIVSVLVDDQRLEVLTFVVAHIDESLASPVGESQRKVGVPEKKQLYRLGLAGVEAESHAEFGCGFGALSAGDQEQVLKRISGGSVKEQEAWKHAAAVDFFKKLLHDTVQAYYSHPLVWSDIGYGGPAYPRGYVRVEKGLTDPWEAKANGE
ncbi:gluconate 2-dehydrogenase subunit 3 family protein [Brevibacillus parabrevis]|uniref:gluconate 2-dehydrogenase subunit 3 family protein n=1 Tax=Brevibacillus parabrevis TaxID=54914 RepID=UPI0028D6812A|nr:gluconate 2-dehydrogenase subunit 3 family protein [Brevibacillus parabrevis]